MIISHIIGGLGNQMFQYAAGRALSLGLNQPFKLDISDFKGYGLRTFDLKNCFNCSGEISTDSDLRHILGWQSIRAIRRLLNKPKLSSLRSKQFIIEPYSHYWPGFQKCPSSSYLLGYWLSEKYFQSSEMQIREDFTFKTCLNSENNTLAAEINSINSVSLHVRRGDYASDSKTMAAHGLCDLSYYYSAIDYIANGVRNPIFFIFSDDISWVRENLKIGYPCRYIDHNHGAEAYNDMRLMSLCKHNIIANSTFSWWGGWLNINPNKIIIAPKRWFASDTIVADYSSFMSDLIPSKWVLM
jgi:hypothetical protein